MDNTKPTNPKDAIGSNKLPLRQYAIRRWFNDRLHRAVQMVAGNK